MIYNLEIYFMLFIIYAFLGWIMECTLCVIQKHKFVNRGFLIGPYCPIYGVGVVSLSLLLSSISNNIFLLFICATVICGVLEYFTSFIMEKFFNARWWDYSDKKYNINGRVCLETLIPFGIIGTLVLKFLNPFILEKLYSIPKNILNYIVIFLITIYIVDLVISLKVIMKFKNMNKKEKDNTEEITKKVRETAEVAIQRLNLEKERLLKFVKQSKLNKRLISAFPNLERKDYTRKKTEKEYK